MASCVAGEIACNLASASAVALDIEAIIYYARFIFNRLRSAVEKS
jgi:hypothetical protein